MSRTNFLYLKLDNYVLLPELSKKRNTTTGIAVAAHEFGHAIGLKDMYDTCSGKSGVDVFSVMAQNRACDDGVHIPPMLCWERAELGWLMPQLITSPVSNFNVLPIEFYQNSSCLQVVPESISHGYAVFVSMSSFSFSLLISFCCAGWRSFHWQF